jgi:23S rRNA G2069 N7-methylase RlmK/C1962 C5-methylase RlmI
LTDAHSRRIAKRLHQVSRWATMERALREVDYDEADVARMLAELMGAFKVSKEAGQAKWKKTREAVLRRRAAADAMQKAEEVEAEAVKLLPGLRAAKCVKKWVDQKYGRIDEKKVKQSLDMQDQRPK